MKRRRKVTFADVRKPLSIADLARLLARSDLQVEQIHRSLSALVANGAPLTADGRIDLVTLMAWTIKNSADFECGNGANFGFYAKTEV